MPLPPGEGVNSEAQDFDGGGVQSETDSSLTSGISDAGSWIVPDCEGDCDRASDCVRVIAECSS